MAELVRVATLTGYRETMASLGTNPEPLLRELGLTVAQLDNPEGLLSARTAIRLLERSAAETGCVTFGLRMAECRSVANLGTASLLIAHQPTLGRMLEALSEFRARINSTLVLHIEAFGYDVVLREDFALRRPEPTRQSSDLALGVLIKLCQSVLGEQWVPLGVCLSHAPPRSEDIAQYVRVFRSRPQFDSEFNGIIVAAMDLERANPKADENLADHARRLLVSAMQSNEMTTTQEVEQLVNLLLPTGRASVQTVSESMGLRVRTLQRMLDAEGSSFSEVLNRARMQLATQYLANPRMRVTDVADMLGYASIGAFSRWHSQAFGIPPRAARKASREGNTHIL